MGDFSAQAVVNTILGNAFPDDPIVGEEDSADIRGEAATTMRNRVVELANESLLAQLMEGDNAAWGIGPGRPRTTDELLNAIDRGNYNGGRTGRAYSAYILEYNF